MSCTYDEVITTGDFKRKYVRDGFAHCPMCNHPHQIKSSNPKPPARKPMLAEIPPEPAELVRDRHDKKPEMKSKAARNPLLIPMILLSFLSAGLLIALVGLLVTQPSAEVARTAPQNKQPVVTKEIVAKALRSVKEDMIESQAAEKAKREAEKQEKEDSLLQARNGNPSADFKMFQVIDDIDQNVGKCYTFDGTTVWCDLEKSSKHDGFEIDVTDSRSERHNGFSEEFQFIVPKPMADTIRDTHDANSGFKTRITCQVISGGKYPVAEIYLIEAYCQGGWVSKAYTADGKIKEIEKPES